MVSLRFALRKVRPTMVFVTRKESPEGGRSELRLVWPTTIATYGALERAKDLGMNYYQSGEVLRLLAAAATGDREAIDRLTGIDIPSAASPDWSEMLLVQLKNATIDAIGRVRVLDMPPEGRGRSQQGLDVYTRNAAGAACSSITLPSAFPVRAVAYRYGTFVFESDDGRSVQGTLAQILQGMRPVQFAPEGATEQQLESSFNSIPGQIPPPPKPRKTAVQNPPIADETIGTFTFDERLQSFYAEYPGGTRLANLRIRLETADREHASELIDVARTLLSNLTAIDRQCKQFGVDKLLDLKNRGWREPGEQIVSEGRFTALINLESVLIDSQGRVTAYYHDGGMFGGHTIVIELDTDHAPIDADLAG